MRASQARARPARGALLVLALALGGATTADADDEALVAQIRRLAERIEKLERRSPESEREVAPAGHAEPGGGAPLEGIDVGGSLTGVVQQVDGRGAATGERESRASYRGDVTVTLPGGRIGGAEGRIFAHLRFGQGGGVTLRPTYTSTPNTTAFQTAASPTRTRSSRRPGIN